MIKLETWFKCNEDDPYPSSLKKAYFAEQTNLTKAQIARWFLKRRKNKINANDNRLSIKQKLVLKDYFNNINKSPNNQNMLLLSKKTGISIKRISSWFSYSRYIYNKKNR